MTTRTTRRAPLNNIESLLLAQAVWEHGAAHASWPAIAKILSKHPLLSRPKSFFTAQSCHTMYENLMKDADLEIHEDSRLPHAPLNLQLAQKHFRLRYAELRELILAEETRFKAILKEIEDIRAGIRVQEIQDKETSGTPPHQIETGSAEQAAEEILSSSEPITAAEPPDSTLEAKDAPNSHGIVAEENSRPTTAAAEVAEKERFLQSSASSPTPLLGVEKDQRNSLDFEAVKKVPASSLGAETEDNDLADAIVDDLADVEKFVDEDEQMEDVDTRESTPISEKQVEENIELIDQRQEEEEEDANEDDETKEEEEEASQGQEELALDGDPNESETISYPKSTQQADMETESELAHTPASEAVASEPEPTADEGHSSGLEELVVTTRRSSRRRKSSAASIAPPQTRTRLRSQARLSESEPRVAAESEIDEQAGINEDSPQIEDEQASSPYDIGPTRRGKRKASLIAADLPHDKKRIREGSEPADEEEPGPSSHNTRARITRHATRTEEQVALKRFQNVIGMLHSQISQHRNGNIFHNPIKNSEAPDYHEIVKRPMDLKTIKTRFKDGVIGNSLEYQRDIYLMFANAMMYNRPGSDVHAMAEDMMLESEGQIIAFRQTEGLVKRGQRP